MEIFQAIHADLAEDKQALEKLVQTCINSEVPTINDVAQHLIGSGGKRIRSTLVLLIARSLGFQGEAHIRLAALIEFMHTATLLHDDVIDLAKERRAKLSSNEIWGNTISVLSGDYLYALAFQMMTSLEHMPILKILAQSTCSMVEGEVLQLLQKADFETDLDTYFKIIIAKTAKLFEVATHTSALLACDDAATIKALQTYGLEVGIAFQLMDDHMDYCSDADTSGKKPGADFNEKKMTFPLIYTLQHCQAADKGWIADLLQSDTPINTRDWKQLNSIMASCGAFEATIRRAKQHTDKALDAIRDLPENRYSLHLRELASQLADRDY